MDTPWARKCLCPHHLSLRPSYHQSSSSSSPSPLNIACRTCSTCCSPPGRFAKARPTATGNSYVRPPIDSSVSPAVASGVRLFARGQEGLALALALDLETEYFAKSLKTFDLCTCRFNHYPPPGNVTAPSRADAAALRIGEHTDFGAFTFLLLPDGVPKGLQVASASGWVDVELRMDDVPVGSSSAIVNTGAQLPYWYVWFLSFFLSNSFSA